MSAHTPGPWKAVPSSNEYGGKTWFVNSEQSYGLAVCGGHEANARLIASAPALLEVLEQIQHVADLVGRLPASHIREVSRAVIRAAKGESLCHCADTSQPREPHPHHFGSQGEWSA